MANNILVNTKKLFRANELINQVCFELKCREQLPFRNNTKDSLENDFEEQAIQKLQQTGADLTQLIEALTVYGAAWKINGAELKKQAMEILKG
jgi:hypothetical protein